LAGACPFNDTTLTMEALLESREKVRHIRRLLENDDGEEEEEDA
jgi:hypothetical protein